MQAIGRIGGGLLAFALASSAGAIEPTAPNEVQGLVAWYSAEALHETLPDKTQVVTWPDASGSGHDLTAASERSPLLRTSRIAGKATVEVHKGDAYAVAQPFDLADHTIFIVYRRAFTQRGLFCGDADAARGVVLGEAGRHVARDGGVGRPSVPYTTKLESDESFHLVVLGREGGRMRAFVDGADRSSMARWDGPLRVGKFFQVTYSKQVAQDGDGLDLAELAFYGRFLGDDERRAVTAHLAQKFGLSLAKEEGGSVRARIEAISAGAKARVARLGASSATDLGAAEGVHVTWNRPERLDPLWAYKSCDDAPAAAAEKGKECDLAWPGRLYATADGTRAHVYLTLALQAAGPGTTLRVLVRTSEEWLPGEARVGPFGGDGEKGRATAALETRAQLKAGDFLEVLVYRSGGEGPVHAVAGESLLLVEAE